MVRAALLVARDMRTTLAKNIAYVERVRFLAMERETVVPPDEDAWRLTYMSKLLEQRVRLHTLGMKEEEEILQSLLDSLCIS